MGLDMYLTKETYVWPEWAEKYSPNRKDLKLECPKVKPERVTKITERGWLLWIQP